MKFFICEKKNNWCHRVSDVKTNLNARFLYTSNNFGRLFIISSFSNCYKKNSVYVMYVSFNHRKNFYLELFLHLAYE